MPATLLKLTDYPNPSKRMKIPLQSEIARYMEEKKGWPKDFCQHYAEKFWNNYNASGWKLSNGNMMKDWQSAFNAQWQNVRFEEDIKKLKECESKAKKRVGDMTQDEFLDYMDKVLMMYKGGFKPDRESALEIYDRLKFMGLMKLPKEISTAIVEKVGNNRDAGKMWCVKELFDLMINNNKNFKNQAK